MVGERFRIRLPDGDRMGHQFAHRWLEVVVTDHTAGDPRGPCGDAGLVEHDHVLARAAPPGLQRSEEHTSELQSHSDLVCRLLLEKKKKKTNHITPSKKKKRKKKK